MKSGDTAKDVPASRQRARENYKHSLQEASSDVKVAPNCSTCVYVCEKERERCVCVCVCVCVRETEMWWGATMKSGDTANDVPA